jgi:hypothetical protein
VLATLLVPGVAAAKPVKQYVLRHPKREHCKAHYVKKAETVKKREHDRTVKVHETLCVYVAPKAPAKATTPAPKTPASTPSPAARLRAHLDPSFTQNPANPLIVTYSYSASAEQESGGVTLPDPNLPSGVLAFYSDGLLVCLMNVGASIAGGECTVTYGGFGTHTINVVYSSGESSATTGPQTVTIEPPPVISTPTTQSVASERCTEDFPYELYCTYEITATTTVAGGEQLSVDRQLTLTRDGRDTNSGLISRVTQPTSCVPR